MTFIYDYTLVLVVIGAVCFGFTAGVCGVFAVLRGQSLLGDAISHATLPGIACTFLITFRKDPVLLLCGGMVAGIIGALSATSIMRQTALKKDAVLGTILSVFFGCGVMLMTIIQKTPCSQQSIINKFLFGSAATLLFNEVRLMIITSSTVLIIIGMFYKELRLIMFDPIFSKVRGYRVTWWEHLLTCLIVTAIAIGLQAMGVVLMSSLLVAPAAAARQWTRTVWTMMVCAGLMGAFSAALGVFISSVIHQLPTGPTIVVILSVLVFVSLLIAPRGIVWRTHSMIEGTRE